MKSHLLIWKLLIPPVLGALIFLISVDPERFENFRRGRMFSYQLNEVGFRDHESAVLILGNSLLQHALPPDKVITARFNLEILKQTAQQNQVHVYKIAVPGLPTIELKKNQQKIFSLHPKVIILQAELIFPNYAIKDPPRTAAKLFRLKTEQIQTWSRLVKVYLVPSLQRVTVPTKSDKLLGTMKTNAFEEGMTEQSSAPDFLTQRLEWLWRKRKVERNAPDYLICKEFINAAHSAGIRVAVLDMPVSKRTLTIGPNNYLEERSVAIRDILGASDFYLRYPNALPDEYFWDYSHLKVKGRFIFFRWTTQNFAQHWSNH